MSTRANAEPSRLAGLRFAVLASIALAAAEPQLDEAVRSGAITDAQRRDLRRRIRSGRFV